MKVLKKGRKQKGWAIEVECTGSGNNGGGGCGAVLLVEQSDLFRTSSSALGEVTYYVTFKCADCGVLTDLPSNKHPAHAVVAGLPYQRDWEAARGK